MPAASIRRASSSSSLGLPITQFLLDRLHLFVEVILALAFLHLRLDPTADALLDLLHVDFAIDQAEQLLETIRNIGRFEDLLLVLQANRQVRGNGIGQA
jgi:hypothetical protein